MERLVSIGEAASLLGVSITTLRRWEASGRLAAEHTTGGHRRYDLAKLKPELFRAEADAQRRTVAYARVYSHDQKDDWSGRNRCWNCTAHAKAGPSRSSPIWVPA